MNYGKDYEPTRLLSAEEISLWREYQRWMSVLEESEDSETAFAAWCQAGRYWRALMSAINGGG